LRDPLTVQQPRSVGDSDPMALDKEVSVALLHGPFRARFPRLPRRGNKFARGRLATYRSGRFARVSGFRTRSSSAARARGCNTSWPGSPRIQLVAPPTLCTQLDSRLSKRRGDIRRFESRPFRCECGLQGSLRNSSAVSRRNWRAFSCFRSALDIAPRKIVRYLS